MHHNFFRGVKMCLIIDYKLFKLAFDEVKRVINIPDVQSALRL